MATPTIRVDMVFRASSAFFGYFIIGTSLIGGSDVIAADELVVDVTDTVESVQINRGRQREIDEFGPSTAKIVFDNADRRWDPDNTLSTYYGQIEPMREVRITAITADLTEKSLFVGYAQDWVPSDDADELPRMELELADAMAILARQDMDEIVAAHSGDLAGARISRVLNLAEVDFPSDKRSIATGKTTFGATTFGTNAAEYLQTCARSEGGNAAVFVNRSGLLTFRERGTAPGSVQAVFSDDGAATAIPYDRVERSFATDLLVNRVIAEGTTGNAQTASDSASQTAYQVRTLSRTGLFASSDTIVQQHAQHLVSRFKAPDLRFRRVDVVDLGDLAEARQKELLGLELLNRVLVERTIDEDTSQQVTQQALVDSIAWTYIARNDVFRLSLGVSDAQSQVGFIIGDADLGVIGVSPIAF